MRLKTAADSPEKGSVLGRASTYARVRPARRAVHARRRTAVELNAAPEGAAAPASAGTVTLWRMSGHEPPAPSDEGDDFEWLSDYDTSTWPPGALDAAEGLGALGDAPVQLTVQVPAARSEDGWEDIAYLAPDPLRGYWRANETTLDMHFGDSGVELDFARYEGSLVFPHDDPEDRILVLGFTHMRVLITAA